jgi:hypothetical protein
MGQNPSDPKRRVVTPEMRERQSAISKARWADPLMREKIIAGMRTTGKRSSGAYSLASKARWADPVISAKMRAALREPATLAKVREALKVRWADPEMRERMVAGMRAAGARRRKRDTAEC